MAKHESRHRTAVNQLARNSRGNALLASAAPLVDDEPTPSSSAKLPANPNGSAVVAPAPAPLPDLPLPDQKIALVSSLLVVGAEAQTTYLLTRFPHLANTYPEIADLQLRAMAYSLGPLLDRSSPTVPDLSKRGADDRKSILTVLAPPPLETSTERFVFFFPDWSEQIERCESVEALFDPSRGVNRALMSLGALVGRDVRLLVRLIRVAAKDVREVSRPPSKSPFSDVV
jgi:THO complex subunit 2